MSVFFRFGVSFKFDKIHIAMMGSGMSKWLYEKEMEQIIGVAFDVRNELGGGWSEEIYHQAVTYLAQKQGIPVQSKPRGTLVHRNVEIHTFEPDLIFWGKIIFELKVLLDFHGKEFPGINQAQLFHYLKFHKLKVGALVNFAHSKVGICRLLYNPSKWQVDEDYNAMTPYVDENDKLTLREVHKSIKAIANQYGLGYPETIYRKLIAIELANQQIPCISELNISATLENHELGTQPTAYMLVANKFLLHIRAAMNGIPKHDYIKTRTYLRSLGLEVGWVVNFGRRSLQIFATAIK